MEADAIKDSRQKDMAINCKHITDFFKPGRTTIIGLETLSRRENDAHTGRYQNQGTPKRKPTNSLTGESPLKQRKLANSKATGGGEFKNSCTVPINIALRDLKHNIQGLESKSDNDREVVVQRDSPGRDTGSRCTDMQPGCEPSL